MYSQICDQHLTIAGKIVITNDFLTHLTKRVSLCTVCHLVTHALQSHMRPLN
jgi:epoxyqueuosine reductase QueG